MMAAGGAIGGGFGGGIASAPDFPQDTQAIDGGFEGDIDGGIGGGIGAGIDAALKISRDEQEKPNIKLNLVIESTGKCAAHDQLFRLHPTMESHQTATTARTSPRSSLDPNHRPP
ncbi:hypothetical protein CDD80_2322 [Ophiocordyceps camponoti-rufipedis]|uniref:Uncharacterized protein n=1 Tax=Ophiocordyceps camponoti-rufipedis TaxID=2004952 RepID=A0A2C5XSK9_9HYPO|nr:hypothetical protein CDD80_2322 [Ophiocordyceps camponoti-rufipedis]